MQAAIVAIALLFLLPATSRAQFDPTVPLPPKVVSAFFPVLDLTLGPVSASSSLPGGGRLFHTTTPWIEDLETGTLDNPVGVSPLQTRGFLLVAGGGTLCSDLIHLQGTASAVAYGPFVSAIITAFPSVAAAGMSTSRILHTATLIPAPQPPGSLVGSPLLTDGRVLVTGGQSQPGLQNVLASAEAYNPNTQTFTPVGSMTTPRVAHRAVRLLDGRVLIVGGVRAHPTGCQPSAPPCVPSTTCNGVALASAEIFDPATNTFTPTGSMATPRGVGHSATLLSDGRVLVAGGITNPPSGVLVDGTLYPALNTTEIYDPVSGTFSSGPPMITARANHTATRLFHVDSPSGICQSSSPLCLAVSGIIPSRVLMAGGSAMAGLNAIFSAPLTTAETYIPSTNSFFAEGSMAVPRTFHAAELLPHGKVLVTGGATPGATNSAELFNPGEGPNAFNFLIPAGPGSFVPTNFPMVAARAGHTLNLTPTVPGGTAVVMGGAPGPMNTVETYIP